MATIPLEQHSRPSLESRYTDGEGRVFLTGIQAIVRLILEQQRSDRRQGSRTAAFVSGYEGSPLGGLDIELHRRSALLDELAVVHRPGLNEELAATAVAGTQLAPARPDSRYEGVVGYWYGKAPGLDRATDALRHANFGGTHPLGGALALVGDDPVSKSSTVTSASEQALAELAIPTVYPADPQEIIDLGLHAIAMSRASGLWSAMKIVTNVADGAADVLLRPARTQPVQPAIADAHGPFRHTPTADLGGPTAVEAERTAYGIRLDVAREYARLNGLNLIESHGSSDRIGIVAAGKTYLDVCQALERLGLDPAERGRQGIRVLKLGMIFPVEPSVVDDFATGLEEIIVIEEKRPFLESALKDLLYGRANAPSMVGKRDLDGSPLFAEAGELDPDGIAVGLARRLATHEGLSGIVDRLTYPLLPLVSVGAPEPSRTAYFCSGCPHNRSTRVPRGSVVGAGIGCHAMVMRMDPERVGDLIGLTQMGGEGAHWIGLAPFVEGNHLLQNIGDGTFHHSGSLAVRAAVAAGINVTYKLLYNSAVAMTGGQEVAGIRTVPEITQILSAEGVSRVIVTTEDAHRYRGQRLGAGTEVWHRDRMDEAQQLLARTGGVTVLIHDQQCATEKRRDLKRHPSKESELRVFINERVCEGCGDCGTKSNCLSVEPVDTDYGRKTRIHQSSCNTDYSCLTGDCPSFITVKPGRRRAARRAPAGGSPKLPNPQSRVPEQDFAIRITGIGGTGVVTVAQIIANAAHIAGLHVRSLDQTGLSQKAGPVVSDIKVSRQPLTRANKLGAAECDLYLGCDLLVAADPKYLGVADPKRTVAVLSTGRVPTGQMVVSVDAGFPEIDVLTARIDAVSRPGTGVRFNARAKSQEGFGGDQYANVMLLGAAYQAGALPLPPGAIEDAIRLNGVAVEDNLNAFSRGRGVAIASPDAPTEAPTPESELDRVLHERGTDLAAYQNRDYAESYVRFVEHVRRVEHERLSSAPGLAIVVARNLYKLMAYKDEYEVARLSLDPAVRAEITEQFGPEVRYSWQLHPPALRKLGLERKISLGPWATPLLRTLRAGRRLRGTPLDPFGRFEVRTVERRMIEEYRAVVTELLRGLNHHNHALALQIAALPDVVRGYESVKLANVSLYHERLSALMADFAGTTVTAH
jgi:indolepyruvate ferredoxin oxidoreductase